MKVNTLEVVWHKKEAIHAFDTIATDQRNVIRIATGGVDCMIRIWLIRYEKDLKSSVEHRATLNRHERGVGAVRFAPRSSGRDYLATAADDSHIIIWKYEAGRIPIAPTLEEDEESIELWSTFKTLRGHREDVSDISWSGDATKFASCGIDHTVIIWEVETGKRLAQIEMHTHYIQGVSFDPHGLLVASLSADRTLRIYHETKKSKKSKSSEWKQKQKIHCIQPTGYERPVRLWWDDTLPGFVRRLNWSPDGLFLACPGAELNPPSQNKDNKVDEDVVKLESNEAKEILEPTSHQKKECVAIFARGTLQTPMVLLPCPEPSVITRWCPIIFKLNAEKPNKISSLSYKMVLAVATSESGIGSLILYETQTMKPICQIEGMHYANMTDLAWCPTGKHLFVSSRDGYVTRIDFTEDELGVPLERGLPAVLVEVKQRLESEGGPEEELPDDEDRLSPKLDKMVISNEPPKTPKRKVDEATNLPKVRQLEAKKSKKKVPFTTIST